MNRLLKLGHVLAAATALAGTVAKADTITIQAQAFGPGAFPLQTIATGSGSVPYNVTLGGWLIEGTASDTVALGSPNLLVSNPVAVAFAATGQPASTLSIQVTASGLTSPFPGANGIASSFRLDALNGPMPTSMITENAQFNNATIASANFDQGGGSAGPIISPENLSGTFSVGEQYTVTTNGLATFNVGMNMSAVPGPLVGAGLPGLIAALGGLVAMARRRRIQLKQNS